MKTNNFSMAPRFRGFTLVELMVALFLGAFLVIALVQFFIGNKSTYLANESLARVQESGRFGMEGIKREIRQAGAHGFCVGRVNIRNHLNSCSGLYDAIFDTDRPIVGLEHNTTGPGDGFNLPVDLDPDSIALNSWNTSSPALNALPAQLENRVVPNTDVLILRSLEVIPNVTAVGNTQANSSSIALVTPDDPGGHGLRPNSLVLVTNCASGADLFQNTTNANSSSFTRGNAPSCAASGPGNQNLPSWSTQYGGSMQAFTINTVAFYVGYDADRDEPGLYRMVIANGETRHEEIVDGIENMQLLYGYSRPASQGGDGQRVTDWLTAEQVPDWGLVIAVQIALLSRSQERGGGFHEDQTFDMLGTPITVAGDGRLRRTFTATIALRNRMLVL